MRVEVERWARAALLLDSAQMHWAGLLRQRQEGKGRRPNARIVERAARRCGLAELTLKEQTNRLETLAAKRREPSDLARGHPPSPPRGHAVIDVATARRLAEHFVAWADHYALDLFPWQREAFGGATHREAGRFVHRLAGISVPRGNGKSWGGSAVGCWRFRFGPQPQLILSCALDYEGARVVLDHGKRILRAHPELEAGVEFLADEVRIRATGSRWLIRSRDHLSSRGLHPDVVLYDEVGWSRDDELFASLLAAQSSVADPLMVVVSTVGKRRSGPLWRIRELSGEPVTG